MQCKYTFIMKKKKSALYSETTAQNVVSFRSSICIQITEIAADTHPSRFVRTGLYGEQEVKRVIQ